MAPVKKQRPSQRRGTLGSTRIWSAEHRVAMPKQEAYGGGRRQRAQRPARCCVGLCGERSEERCLVKFSTGVRMRQVTLHKSPHTDHVRRLTAQRSRPRASHNVWAPRRPLQRLLRCRNGAATLLFGCFYTHWQTTLARQRSWVAFGWGRPG